MRFDVVVIGGGIHGAGVAQACAAAGHRVLVLEKYAALAQGTSSRSSKLIHGGLRYLETLSVGLVHECLRERALLLKNAPELVSLKHFHIPVYALSRRQPARLHTGLALYALLGGGAYASLPRSAWDSLDGLTTQGLRAVFRYRDAQTDDAHLTRAVMHSAQTLGATLEMQADVTAISLNAQGCEIAYRQGESERSCGARVLVNATGPWAADVLTKVTPVQAIPGVELVQGTHLLLPGALEQGLYYVEAAFDGRPVFVMPWDDRTLIGTTELPYHGAPDHVQPTTAEIGYLLDTHARYFPQRRCSEDQVQAAYAGLRVLPKLNANAGQRSRETLILADRPEVPRLLSIFGGKLTAYRATAEKVLRQAAPSLPGAAPHAATHNLRLEPVD